MALIPGNLLDEESQSFKNSVGDWESVSGGTLTHDPGNLGIGWLEPETGIGRIEAAGTSDVVIGTATGVPVDTGAEYVAYIWLAALEQFTATVSVEWFDDTDTSIGVTSSPEFSGNPANGDSTLHITRASVAGTAPVGAATARLRVSVSSTETGALRYADHAYFGTEANPIGNLLTFDEYSVESSADGWEVVGAERSHEPLITNGNEGVFALGMAPVEEGVIEARTTRLIPVTGGTTYRVSALMASRTSDDPNATLSCRTIIRWYDADGELIGSGPDEPFFEPTPASQFAAAIVGRTDTAPEDAAYARPVVQILHTPNTTASIYYADMMVLAAAQAAYEIRVNQQNGYIRLEVREVPPGVKPPVPDDPETPEDETDPGTLVSVWRYDESGKRYPVRGYGGDWIDVPFSGSGTIVVEDYEAPIGSRVYYRVVWSNLDTSTGVNEASIDTRTVTAPSISDPSMVWLKSPGQPGLNRQVMMAENLSWERAARSAVYPVVGRSSPVVISEVRSSKAGQIKIRVGRLDEHSALEALLSSGLPILLQVTPGYAGITGNLYLAVGDVQWEPESWSAAVPGWLWTLNVTEIDRPAGGIEGSADRTWQDVLGSHQTWREIEERYGSWTDVLAGKEG